MVTEVCAMHALFQAERILPLVSEDGARHVQPARNQAGGLSRDDGVNDMASKHIHPEDALTVQLPD